MLAPVLRKLVLNKETFIERVLPVQGSIYVKEKDVVKPFDRLGECVFSQKRLNFLSKFRPYKLKGSHQFYYVGADLGKLESKKFIAPFNGYLTKKIDGTFVFEESENKFMLLSGVWGEVSKVLPNKSVLLKTQTQDLLLAASTFVDVAGELVVFPNPTDILEKYYLESFSKSNEGKIIYVGHYADLDLVKKAYEMGVAGILTGSAHRETFNFAKSRNLALGLISGFGKLMTPDPIFKLLSAISYRYVFFQGERDVLRIPNSPEDVKDKPMEVPNDKKLKKTSKSKIPTKKLNPTNVIVKPITKGVDVLILQSPHFGEIGTVDTFDESSIFVKFGIEKTSVEIKLPNFFIIE